MDPLLIARLRRQWPLLTALLVLVGFAVAHVLVFSPIARRYKSTLERAGTMGLALGGGDSAPPLPPSVFALLMDHSLPAAEADAKGASGALGAELVQQLSTLAGRHGLEVVVAEPGVLTQQPVAVETRAHLRLRGNYSGFVAMLDELTRNGSLVMFERLSLVPAGGGRYDIELYVSSCLLRRQGGGA